jgi:IclR family transcriptional regulator, acetate operon repressor
MSVKRSNSAARVLTLLETIADHQPIGVRALARLLDEDKSAIHRALMTLADNGWIRTTSEPPIRWEVTAHVLAVAHAAHGGNDLRKRARPALERLRDDTNETVLLVLPDMRRFVVADVIESRQMLRVVLQVGNTVSAVNTATGRAVLPFLDAKRQTELLGSEPDQLLLDRFAQTRARGYAISEGEINPATTNLGAPIFDFHQQPMGAVVVSGPRERLTKSSIKPIAEKLMQTARELSLSLPAPSSPKATKRTAK